VNELALFAGAGGGLLASHLLGIRPVCAVEWDDHTRCVLVARQNDGSLPVFPIWDDVRTFDGRPWRGRIDIVSGGFPCQAFSSAASGRNNAEDLWPEMRRIVADVAPWLVWAENVSERAINGAADDCEAMGYQARCLRLSASDMGADHVRERFWLLAHADKDGQLLRALNAKVASLPGIRAGVWETYPNESRVADGLAHWVDRLEATGNGQVPAVALAALAALTRAHLGLTPTPNQ
jgi:DNA (cytosine-5)-methyltransferase 1